MAGGVGSLPLAGTAVYMTSYPRLKDSPAVEWEKHTKERDWRYQTPAEILVKASNGASDFGNKFGQPLICGSLLTFEGKVESQLYAYDRCVMLAGGVGYARLAQALKKEAELGNKVVILGGDNYRIGMAGGSVSSVASGEMAEDLELSAVQRANPEMQKRVYNVIRALCERDENPVRLIHDHGAGGHVNCLSELLEDCGGRIQVEKLPVGDQTLSPMELLCNESQERMGLIVAEKDIPAMQKLAAREKAPMYVVGEVTNSGRIEFVSEGKETPLDLPLEVLFGSLPETVLTDSSEPGPTQTLDYKLKSESDLKKALIKLLSLEAVACKDWLTNKVDRCVSGLVAQQQCVGPLQLPLCDYGAVALDYSGNVGIATSIGSTPVAGLLDPAAGARLSIAEALTNIVFAPLKNGHGLCCAQR